MNRLLMYQTAIPIVEINNQQGAFAKANIVECVGYHAAFADCRNGFTKKLNAVGCHLITDTYYIMEGLVLMVISRALK